MFPDHSILVSIKKKKKSNHNIIIICGEYVEDNSNNISNAFSYECRAKDYIIVNDGYNHGGSVGQYSYGHFWKEENGKLIRVDYTMKRLEGGRIRIRQSERPWKEEDGLVDQEERQKRPWYYNHWIRLKNK